LVYKVFDEDSLRGDDYIGGGVVPLKDIVSKHVTGEWLPLYESKKPTEIKRDSTWSKMVNWLTNDKKGQILISFELGPQK